MVTRRAVANDSAAIARLSSQLGYPVESGTVEDAMRQLEEDRDHAVFVAEDAGGSVVGWIHVFATMRPFAAGLAEIGGLVVDEASRRQGVGRRLLQEAENWSRRKGCSTVLVRSNVMREIAPEFYREAGYRILKTQTVFRKDLHNQPAAGRLQGGNLGECGTSS